MIIKDLQYIMLRPIGLWMLLVCIVLLSCESNVETLDEIPVSGSNADIIRNPVTADAPADTAGMARIVFDQPTYDFGQVKDGEQVRHSYRFTNRGRQPLVINDVRTTCGCTVPDWPKYAIPSGEQADIKVSFDATNRVGRQDKSITIVANTYPIETRIYLQGEVIQ